MLTPEIFIQGSIIFISETTETVIALLIQFAGKPYAV
jgi:hypothetical protein